METKKKSWTELLFAYAKNEKKKMLLSVILSVLSVTLGLAPFYCMLSGNLPVYGRNGDDWCRRAVVPLDVCVLCR